MGRGHRLMAARTRGRTSPWARRPQAASPWARQNAGRCRRRFGGERWSYGVHLSGWCTYDRAPRRTRRTLLRGAVASGHRLSSDDSGPGGWTPRGDRMDEEEPSR
jgi:hypothetical protein